ncbi:sugar diacid recognition domain-containing protein [Clostridium sp.]|uniref:CdaR family transcriptional regulator n=1 Tax=Clostridium sp. TaxID=1506 RepID=UPI001A5CB55C|nr:sugar diacid recognition domain-containing protein [Clostridium sp.]MBK5234994.1 helix-turn-helix domain-containing protein [Clostridium sp.]
MSLLGPALAQKFIDKTAKNLEYNVNIMNDKGIIIASKDTSRIGNFHEVAFNLLNGTLGSGIVNDGQKYLGTKPGVNLFIDYKDKHVGVICVSGAPESVNAFAQLVKSSMEVMLEYEINMDVEHVRKNKTEQFLYYLLFEEKLDMLLANTMAEELEISKNTLRTCIIIKHNSQYDSINVMKTLMSAEGHTSQDIISTATNGDIVMFKAINIERLEAIRDYKLIISDYLNDFFEEDSDKKMSITVGSLQDNISKYRESYLHAQELGLEIKGNKGIYFFNDYILDYIRRIATIKVYDNIFSVYNTLFSEQEKTFIAESVEVLNKNNYNIVNTSKALFMHRNTLLFRLNKIKDTLNIDPIANAAHREFLNELAYYFRRT